MKSVKHEFATMPENGFAGNDQTGKKMMPLLLAFVLIKPRTSGDVLQFFITISVASAILMTSPTVMDRASASIGMGAHRRPHWYESLPSSDCL